MSTQQSKTGIRAVKDNGGEPNATQPKRRSRAASSKVSNLKAAMLSKLAESALTADDARALGLLPCTAQDAAALDLSKPFAGFKIPYFDLDGQQTEFFRFRYLESTKTGFAALTNAKAQRYAQPAGSANELYLPPLATGTTWRTIAENPAIPLVITEGELKAACATKKGFPTVGLGGVWNFKSKDAPLLPMFEQFAWDGRTVHICYDSDAVTNPKVKKAESALARELALLGARPYIVRLPFVERDGNKKTGLDDYLVEQGAKSFKTLLEDAAEWQHDDASPFSDLGNAYRVQRNFNDCLAYATGMEWLVWDGVRWHPSNLAAQKMLYDLGRIIREEAAATEDRDKADALWKHAHKSENAGKIDAALKLAAPLLERRADSFDADPYLLGCNNGAVDLRTGRLTPPKPDLLITKTTGHDYDAEAGCPTWMAFLQRIFRGHPEMVPFLQQLAGYWLTGLTDPPYLAVLYGGGENGKTSLVETLQYVLGDYADSAPRGLLMTKSAKNNSETELAKLQGKRFVTTAETNEGGRLDEELVKAMTGGDQIAARRLYGHPFTFSPTHKLALTTNHKPIVRGTDSGIWRRLLLIPFEESIPKSEQDPKLRNKLRAEAKGILAWAVAGARRFLADSKIKLPQVIVEATKEYRTESDVIGMFLEEMCLVDRKGTVLSSALYMAYEGWAEANGEHVLSRRALTSRLQDRGFAPTKVGKNGDRAWRGLTLRNGSKF